MKMGNQSPDDKGINNIKGQKSERSCIMLLPKQEVSKYSDWCPSDLSSSHLVLILQIQNYVCSVLYILFSSCQLALFGYPEGFFSCFFLSCNANARV
jgi:hypothetical protein